MKTQLLCTFTKKPTLNESIDIIISCNDILYDKIYTFEDVDAIFFTTGTAPQLGLVTLYVPEFSYDITVTYTISYRLLDGKECL